MTASRITLPNPRDGKNNIKTVKRIKVTPNLRSDDVKAKFTSKLKNPPAGTSFYNPSQGPMNGAKHTMKSGLCKAKLPIK
jgi:hypothetical protein